jgi:hypothetical protein
MIFRSGRYGLVFVIVTLLLSSGGHADTPIANERFKLRGFTTIGAVKGGDEYLGFREELSRAGTFDGDWSAKAGSILGLQLDAKISQKFSSAVQVVAKDRIEHSLSEAVEWAYLRYRLNPSITLRAGRIGTDIFMLSDHRNIGFAYLWVRPPGEFYSILSFHHFDGADITYITPLGSGSFMGKFQYGKTKNTFTSSGDIYDFKLNPGISASLGWENELWSTRVSVASVKVDSQKYIPRTELLAQNLLAVSTFWPEAEQQAQDLEAEGLTNIYYAIGLSFTPQNWHIQSEVGHIDSEIAAYGSLLSGYLSVGRELGPTTVYGILAKAKKSDSRHHIGDAPPGLEPLQTALQALYHRTQINQQTASLGIRWNIRYDVAIKAQWDHTEVSAYGASLWDQRTTITEDRSLNTYTINLNYVF